MSPERILFFSVTAVALVIGLLVLRKKLPARLKSTHYTKKWRDIQKLCANKDDWAHAIVHADMLLDEVMKKKKVTGKTTGERLVNVQGKFSDHESVWDAHKLANSLRTEGAAPIPEQVVKQSLVAFRQALRDLGAL